MLNTSVNLNKFFNPYFSLYKIPSNYFNSNYSKIQTIQINFSLPKLYFMLLIRNQIEQIQCINKLLADWFNKGPFKNNVTAKMQNFRPPSPLCHFQFLFSIIPPPPYVTKQKVLFPRLKALSNNFTHFVYLILNWHGLGISTVEPTKFLQIYKTCL